MDVPEGHWVRVRVQSRLGGDGATVWSLTATRPGAEPLRLTDLPCPSGWKSVDWVGFVSAAEHPTAVYLDDLELNVGP